MISVRISVRNLIEFILRDGDIDNRYGSFSDDAMKEGAKLHRVIQHRAGSDYQPEVSLKYTYSESDVSISVEGRADGVIRNDSGVTVDEIKTTYSDIQKLKEANSLHLAQAKFYAYIIAEKENLPAIKVRITYANIDTEEIRYFNYTFLYEELLNFTSEVCHEYVKWARLESDWHEVRDESIKALPFPFEYRPGQEKLVRQVYVTISKGKKLFIEAPTGVGKTISTLYPALYALANKKGSRLFYLTAKTITRTVAENTIDILKSKGMRLKNITITAKEKICPTESHECNPDACPYAKGHFTRVNDCVYDLLANKEQITAGVVLDYAAKYMVCPFEMSLDASMFCDAIICDYNYAFDPSARLKRFFEDETKSGDYLMLVDEAHNLLDRAREMYSAAIFKEQLHVLKRLTEEELPTISAKASKCEGELSRLEENTTECSVDMDITDFVSNLTRLYGNIERFLKEERKPKKKKKISKDTKDGVLEFFFEAGHFLNTYDLLDDNYRVYAAFNEKEEFFLKLFCVNPRENLKECMKAARSVILFSATLLPIQYYKELLAGEPGDYEVYAESIFNPKNRRILIASDVTSKYTKRTDSEYLKLARYINKVVKSHPGNYMVFFPSYKFMEEVHLAYLSEFTDDDETSFLVQSTRMTEDEKDDFLRRFSTCKEQTVESLKLIDMEVETEDTSSLVGLCVLGGAFSEGVDLTSESLIGAIVVGTGIPQVCLERKLMMETFDKENGLGFDYAYRYPGVNKVLQAAGRVIRTETDRGVIVLLDNRFLQSSYQKTFPREWTDFDRVNLESVERYVKKFWDGN